MCEEPIFIEHRISHYGAMLKLDLNSEDRALLDRLLARAERKLTAAIDGQASEN